MTYTHGTIFTKPSYLSEAQAKTNALAQIEAQLRAAYS